MEGDVFEWDDVKAASNLAKHRVSFDTASRVFQDPFAIDESENASSFGENRFYTIGQVDGRILFVAYATSADRIRIISARGAEPYEKRRYTEEAR